MTSKFTAKNIVCLVLVLLYFLGLILMITGNLSQGIACWVVSTIGGAAALAIIKGREERAEAKAETEKDAGADA